MKALVTEGIVLSRINFGEADRILTILTPEQGKLRLIAKGVRKIKSKLAGGVELFSVTEISYISGKSDIGTLVSSRLKTHYGRIVTDIDRVQLGYDLIKTINRATEDHPESDYFDLLNEAFLSLDDHEIDNDLIKLWFGAQLLKINGHMPNLYTNYNGQKLEADHSYSFDVDEMVFSDNSKGRFKASNIKVMRLVFSDNSLSDIKRVDGLDKSMGEVTKLINAMLVSHLSNVRLGGF
jgi:DNA repair protein RecO